MATGDFNQEYQPSHKKSRVSEPFLESMNWEDCDLVDSRESPAVVALDLSKSERSYGKSAACPPDRRLRDAFHKMLVIATKILNGFIDCLKPLLRELKALNQWPFNNLLLKDIDEAQSMSDIFNIIRVEKCWLNTEVLGRLVSAVTPFEAGQKADHYLKSYNHKLGEFARFVLAKHVPADELTCGGTQAVAQKPKLLATCDKEYEHFTVADLLEHKDFLCETFRIPSEQFQYIERSTSAESPVCQWDYMNDDQKFLPEVENATKLVRERLLEGFQQKDFKFTLSTSLERDLEQTIEMLERADLVKIVKTSSDHGSVQKHTMKINVSVLSNSDKAFESTCQQLKVICDNVHV